MRASTFQLLQAPPSQPPFTQNGRVTRWTAEASRSSISGPSPRDNDGRIYEERWTLIPNDGSYKSQKTTIQIGDPTAHTLYNCFMFNKPRNCFLGPFNETTAALYKPAFAKSGPLPHTDAYSTHEDLGKDSIDGIGTRDTVTYNKGAIGNDRPISVKREFWYAPSMGINLRFELRDPSFGKQLFTITDVTLSEPDPKLYELPPGFEVVDHRKPPELAE